MDAVDRQLIQALRENGRASYAELGRLVGLSGPSVTDRINRLEAAGVITGYRATVTPPRSASASSPSSASRSPTRPTTRTWRPG